MKVTLLLLFCFFLYDSETLINQLTSRITDLVLENAHLKARVGKPTGPDKPIPWKKKKGIIQMKERKMENTRWSMVRMTVKYSLTS